MKRTSAGRYKQTVGRNPPTLPPDEAYGSLNCGRSTPLPTSPLTPRVRVALVNADLPTSMSALCRQLNLDVLGGDVDVKVDAEPLGKPHQRLHAWVVIASFQPSYGRLLHL